LRAVDVVKGKIEDIKTGKTINPTQITVIVDFFRTYADRFHNGKEEGILFSELTRKRLGEADKKVIKELIMEHTITRRNVTALEDVKESFMSGNTEALNTFFESTQALADLYPKHIEKEDKRFFYPSMEYFSKQEQEDM